MPEFLDSSRYHQLHARLTRLQAAHVLNTAEIDTVIELIALEQQRFKADEPEEEEAIEARYGYAPAGEHLLMASTALVG